MWPMGVAFARRAERSARFLRSARGYSGAVCRRRLTQPARRTSRNRQGGKTKVMGSPEGCRGPKAGHIRHGVRRVKESKFEVVRSRNAEYSPFGFG
jgi:hypothetical protein